MSVSERDGVSTARRFPVEAVAALGLYCGLILTAHLWGTALRGRGVRTGLEAPPLFGRVAPEVSPALAGAALFAVLVVVFWDAAASRLSWRVLLGASGAGAAFWAVLLAASRGWEALTAPVLNPLDAYVFLDRMPPAGEFLRTFTDRIATYPIHVQGHPPGLPLLLRMMEAVGLARPGVVAGLYVAAGAAAIPAVLVAVRRVAGEDYARSAAPWLVLAPFALWIATSADALYLGVAAWGVALAVPGDRESPGRPLAGGVLLGLAGLLTYGAAALVLVPLTVAAARRSFRSLAYAAAGGAAVLGAFALAGFWWFNGLAATRQQYHAGLGGLRPYGFFLLSNLAALAIACGPAALRGLFTLRGRAALLVAGALAAVAAANLSGLSKGEVERIWLLFIPWIVLAAGGIAHRRRFWLGASAAGALVVQALVETPW